MHAKFDYFVDCSARVLQVGSHIEGADFCTEHVSFHLFIPVLLRTKGCLHSTNDIDLFFPVRSTFTGSLAYRQISDVNPVIRLNM